MLNDYQLRGTIHDIGDVTERNNPNGGNFDVLEFLLFVPKDNTVRYSKDQYVTFEITGNKKVRNFLNYHDLGKEVVVWFKIETYPSESGGYFQKLRPIRVYTYKIDVKNYDNPDFPTEKIL